MVGHGEEDAGAKLVQQPIPMGKLLQLHGKTHLELLAANEQLERARSAIDALSQQLKATQENLGNAERELAALKSAKI